MTFSLLRHLYIVISILSHALSGFQYSGIGLEIPFVQCFSQWNRA
jgi:hypothetical protein